MAESLCYGPIQVSQVTVDRYLEWSVGDFVFAYPFSPILNIGRHLLAERKLCFSSGHFSIPLRYVFLFDFSIVVVGVFASVRCSNVVYGKKEREVVVESNV